ncbi:hypothetical protein GIB67_037255 [Kingdonia uniflora]|uniref:Uncharacterized protein n=1 Tax=Kingdonia uniflora TaxID=39325 RepID=A0A7J7MSA4_9MAGN|nr:hypothetical protein GIB67_037255 [Kingdonia uniflora]
MSWNYYCFNLDGEIFDGVVIIDEEFSDLSQKVQLNQSTKARRPKTPMATQTRSMFQDENLAVHGKGVLLGNENITSKTKKTTVRHALKPLTNITNSGRPSPQKVLKKKFPKKFNDNQESLVGSLKKGLIQNENLNARVEGASVGLKSTQASKAQNKAAVGGRKALANITNSKKPCPQKASKADTSKYFDIAQEGFLHDHRKCIDSQTQPMDMDQLWRSLGIEEDFPLETPSLRPLSEQAKADFGSPPRYLEYIEIPELSPPRPWIPSPIRSPSPSGYTFPDLEYKLLFDKNDSPPRSLISAYPTPSASPDRY